MMERENKKERGRAKKEFNETVSSYCITNIHPRANIHNQTLHSLKTTVLPTPNSFMAERRAKQKKFYVQNIERKRSMENETKQLAAQRDIHVLYILRFEVSSSLLRSEMCE